MLDASSDHLTPISLTVFHWNKPVPVNSCGLVMPYGALLTWVNIDSGNCWLPNGTKPLSKLMSTSHQVGAVAFTWEQSYGKFPKFFIMSSLNGFYSNYSQQKPKGSETWSDAELESIKNCYYKPTKGQHIENAQPNPLYLSIRLNLCLIIHPFDLYVYSFDPLLYLSTSFS